MASVSVQVEGMRELVRDLERAGVEVSELKQSFNRIATVAASTAQGFMPRKTGALAATARPNNAKNKAVVTFGKARVPYAGPILYGWPKRGIKAATTIARTDAVMDTKAPALFTEELDRIFTLYGFD